MCVSTLFSARSCSWGWALQEQPVWSFCTHWRDQNTGHAAGVRGACTCLCPAYPCVPCSFFHAPVFWVVTVLVSWFWCLSGPFPRRAVFLSWGKFLLWGISGWPGSLWPGFAFVNSSWSELSGCRRHSPLWISASSWHPALAADPVSFRHAFGLGWCWRHCWRCQLCGSHGRCWYSSSLHVGGVGEGDDCKQRQPEERPSQHLQWQSLCQVWYKG